MKQIHIRRFLSLLLAALTLWAAAVTAGSDSAAAALQQLRQGSRLPQQALRWELGDFFGLDSLSAVTVMTPVLTRRSMTNGLNSSSAMPLGRPH